MKVHLGVQKSSSLKPTKLNTKSNDEGPCFSQKGDNKGGNNVILRIFFPFNRRVGLSIRALVNLRLFISRITVSFLGLLLL